MSSVPDPVQPSLESCESELRRGRDQAIQLREEVRTFFEVNPYEIVPHHEPGARYELSILGLGRALTPEEEGKTGFPSADDPTRFPAGRIQYMRPGEKTRITELQPYNAFDPSIWGGPPEFTPSPLAGALGRLEATHNIDKHRKLGAVWHGVTGFPTVPTGFGGSTRMDRLEDGAEIGRWDWGNPEPMPEIPENLDLKPYFPIGVAVGDIAFANDAVDLLAIFTNAVTLVVDVFRPCIDSGDPPRSLARLVGGVDSYPVDPSGRFPGALREPL